ncbi:MAG TPA: GvpL/GvpF family gas vesicle protein [Trebonia sp.]|jgi:hypothetical protein|nr:GvpL/GvpF family gas vesicle protein [Trebonia sp.]
MTDSDAPVQDAPAIWVYALAERSEAGLPRLTGVAGGSVRLIDADGLTAVVSNVTLEEFGEEALRHNLEDLAWLEAVARAHHGVVDAAAQRFTLVPMRLATVYSGEETMVASLTEHAAQFRSAIERVRSRTEWGVKAYVVPAKQDTAAARPGPARPAGQTEGVDSGLAYLRRRRDALSASRDSARGAADSAQAVHAELEEQAVDTRLHPPQSAQLSGRSEPMVLNAAYLLDDDRADGFASAVEALGDQHPRLRLELTGPWPPYSFTAQDLEQEDA